MQDKQDKQIIIPLSEYQEIQANSTNLPNNFKEVIDMAVSQAVRIERECQEATFEYIVGLTKKEAMEYVMRYSCNPLNKNSLKNCIDLLEIEAKKLGERYSQQLEYCKNCELKKGDIKMYQKQTHAAIEKANKLAKENEQLKDEIEQLKQKLNRRKWWKIWNKK